MQNSDLKVKRIRLSAILYFILLGVINIIATITFADFKWIDVVLFIVLALPLLLNRKLFHLLYGFCATMISLYMGIICLVFILRPNSQTSPVDLFMGFLFALVSLTASLAMMYVGMHSENNKEFRLI